MRRPGAPRKCPRVPEASAGSAIVSGASLGGPCVGRGATLLEPSSPLGRPEAEGGGRLGQGESPGVSLARAGADPAPGPAGCPEEPRRGRRGLLPLLQPGPRGELAAPLRPRPPPAASAVHPGVGARTQPAAPHARWADTAQSEWTGVEIRARSHERAPVSARDELQTRPEPGAVLNPSGCTGESPSSPPRAPRGSESESAAPWRAEGGPDRTASSAPAPRPPSASLSQWVNDSSAHPVPTAEVAVSSRVRIRRGDRTPAVRSTDRPRRACSPCTAASKRVFASHTFKCHKVERFTEGRRDRATFF